METSAFSGDGQIFANSKLKRRSVACDRLECYMQSDLNLVEHHTSGVEITRSDVHGMYDA